MLKKMVFVLSALLFSLSLLSLGLFYGFNYACLLHEVTYKIGNMSLSGPGPYENSIFLQRIISFFSMIAFFSFFSEKRMLSKVLNLFSLLIIVVLYIVLYLSKLRYLNNMDSYFDFMRDTLWLDIAGCILALACGFLAIYFMINRKENKNIP